jgi:hypothetical protein
MTSCRGGTGNDTLRGGFGADSLSGGTGNDVFFIDYLDEADTLPGGCAPSTRWRWQRQRRLPPDGGALPCRTPAGWLVEFSGGGRDLLVASVDFFIALPDFVEDLLYYTARGQSPTARLPATISATASAACRPARSDPDPRWQGAATTP